MRVATENWLNGSSRLSSARCGRPKSGSAFTVSRLTVITCPIKRKMYSGSSSRLGSFVISQRLQVESPMLSITYYSAERLPSSRDCFNSGPQGNPNCAVANTAAPEAQHYLAQRVSAGKAIKKN